MHIHNIGYTVKGQRLSQQQRFDYIMWSALLLTRIEWRLTYIVICLRRRYRSKHCFETMFGVVHLWTCASTRASTGRRQVCFSTIFWNRWWKLHQTLAHCVVETKDELAKLWRKKCTQITKSDVKMGTLCLLTGTKYHNLIWVCDTGYETKRS